MSEDRGSGKQDHVSVLSSVFAIIIGLLVGFIIPLARNPSQMFSGFIAILTGAPAHGLKGIRQVLYYATPIVLTGLSVKFVFKTGLFNIGAPGQFVAGAFAAMYMGIICGGLGPIHWITALFVAVLGDAAQGLVPGLLKAYSSMNEVIASITISYIRMYIVSQITESYEPLFNSLRNKFKDVAVTTQIPKMGMDKLSPESNVDGGILVAATTVFLIWTILNKTTFGSELKAAGSNHSTNKHTGISGRRSIIIDMMIVGAVAGMADGLLYLASTRKHVEVEDVLASRGLMGISIALSGPSHPVGVFFSGLFITHLAAGGFYLQPFEFSTEITDIIVAMIICFSALVLIIETVLGRVYRDREKGGGQA